MLPCGQCCLDEFGLCEDGESDDDGLDVFAEEEIVVGFPSTGIVRVEFYVGGGFDGLGGFEGARVDCFEGEVGSCGDGGLGELERWRGSFTVAFGGWIPYEMRLAGEDARADQCYSDGHFEGWSIVDEMFEMSVFWRDDRVENLFLIYIYI